jgi:hypothetical protein
VNRAALAILLVAGICAPLSLAQSEKPAEKKPAPPAPTSAPATTQPKKGDMPAMTPPPGMTAEDMQACAVAGTPGPMHEWLAKAAGTYQGKVTMKMTPEAPAMESTCTTTITPIFDGRYIQVETHSEFMGMPFEGRGVYGYDNVSKKFVSTWIDNCGTGMVTGTGSVSTDGKVLTLNEKMNCPIQKKEIAMREVQTFKDDGSMTVEMYGPDKTGKEFKSMEIVYGPKTQTKAADGSTTDMKAKPPTAAPAPAPTKK